jgi:hypothetical protein
LINVQASSRTIWGNFVIEASGSTIHLSRKLGSARSISVAVVIVSGIQSQKKKLFTRFVNWMIEHSELSAAPSAYLDIVDKGHLVTAAEIIAASVYPLTDPANLHRFIHEYYFGHGRINSICRDVGASVGNNDEIN